MEEKIQISLIIPMYNEKEILPETLAAVSSFMKEEFREGYEVIFSDDGSLDGSADIVEAFPDPRLRALRGKENRGKGNAVKRGMCEARGEIRIFTDCDLAYGTAVVGEVYRFLRENTAYGAAVGSRHLHPEGYAGYSFVRRVMSRAYRLFLRLFGGLSLSDSQSGIKGFTAEAAEAIFRQVETEGYAFDFEVILLGEKKKIAFAEIPVKVVGNRPGHIRLLRDSLRMVRDIRRIRRRIRKMA